VASFYTTWLELKKLRRYRPRTISSARTRLAPFIADHGEKPLTAIKLTEVEAFVYKKGDPQTQTGWAETVSNFFNEAQARKLIGPNPTDLPTYGLVWPNVDETPQTHSPLMKSDAFWTPRGTPRTAGGHLML